MRFCLTPHTPKQLSVNQISMAKEPKMFSSIRAQSFPLVNAFSCSSPALHIWCDAGTYGKWKCGSTSKWKRKFCCFAKNCLQIFEKISPLVVVMSGRELVWVSVKVKLEDAMRFVEICVMRIFGCEKGRQPFGRFFGGKRLNRSALFRLAIRGLMHRR